MSEYHKSPRLSSSQIAAFINDPIAWYHEWKVKDWPRTKATADMDFGTAVHRMIEVGGWQDMVKEIPASALNADGHCKGKAWLEWKAANPSDVYLKPGEPNPLRVIWEHLQANTWVRDVIRMSAKEVEFFWDDEEFGPCRVKFDAICSGMIIDWKTTSCRNARMFARDVVERSYDVRMAFYRRAFRIKYGVELPDVYLVAICTSGGMHVTPYQLSGEWLDDAEARLVVAVDDMQRFDIQRHLDKVPDLLTQPRWSNFNLEEVA